MVTPRSPCHHLLRQRWRLILNIDKMSNSIQNFHLQFELWEIEPQMESFAHFRFDFLWSTLYLHLGPDVAQNGPDCSSW